MSRESEVKKPKEQSVTVEFESIKSLKKAIDRCSIIFFRCFIPEEFIKRNFNNYNALITIQNAMFNKSINAINILNLTIHSHASKEWHGLEDGAKQKIKELFELFCKEFCELVTEFGNQRSKSRKDSINIGKS